MVLQKLWVSQNFRQISRVSQSCSFSAYASLTVSFFIQSCLRVSIFCKAKGLKSWFVHLLVFINDFFSSLDIKFQWSNLQISEKNLILTSPKLSEFYKKLQNLPKHSFWCQKTLRCHNVDCYNWISISSHFKEAG